MGARGPVGKNEGRQRRNAPMGSNLVPAGVPAGDDASAAPARVPLAMPEPKKHWFKSTREWWEAAWATPLARFWEASDLGELGRLADYVDEHERMMRAYREQRFVPKYAVTKEGIAVEVGFVINPSLAVAAKIETLIRPLEDRLGLSMMARARAGVKLAEAARSIDGLGAGVRNAAERDSEDEDAIDGEVVEDEGDPRLD